MNRTIAPDYSTPNQLNLQFPETVELENGVQLYWIKDVKDNSVKLDIEWCAGSKYQSKKLTASFANKLLLSGFDGKNATQIAEEIDYYGGFLQREMDRDHAGVTLYGLAENMPAIFKVFSESFLKCTFPQDEFEKELQVTFARFKIDTQKVKNKCRRAFNQNLFGTESPYGQVANEADFDQLTREDVMAFHQAFYLKGRPTIFIVGNVTDELIDRLREWSKAFPETTPEYAEKAAVQNQSRIDVEVPDAIQSAIRIGRLMFDKKHPDYFDFQLLNTLFGGYFGSRLMMNIREDKGYTYGIGSGMSVMEDEAYFFITTEVGKEVKEAAITEIFTEMDRLKTELVSADELTKVKNYMMGDFLRHSDGPIAMMENYKNIHFNELESTYYTDFIKAITAVTAERLMELAQKYWKREDLTVVTAG